MAEACLVYGFRDAAYFFLESRAAFAGNS